MSEKITGYSLIALGLLIIFFSLISAWSIFSGQSTPPQVFSFEGIGFDLTQLVGGDLPPQQATLLRQQLGEQKTEVISGDVLSKPLNLAAYLLFMGFVASVGAKIASIGTQLVRPIKVDLKNTQQKV